MNILSSIFYPKGLCWETIFCIINLPCSINTALVQIRSCRTKKFYLRCKFCMRKASLRNLSWRKLNIHKLKKKRERLQTIVSKVIKEEFHISIHRYETYFGSTKKILIYSITLISFSTTLGLKFQLSPPSEHT